MKRKIIEPKSSHLLLCVILAVVTFSVNFSMLYNGFAHLDNDVILNNADIRDIRNLPRIFTSRMATDYRPAYRPLTVVTFMMDHFLWEYEPRGYHLTSLILHIMAVLLFYGLFSRISGNKRGAAFISALLYALHPLHTEGVAFVSGRSGAACAMLGAACLLLLSRIDPMKPAFRKRGDAESSKSQSPTRRQRTLILLREKALPAFYLLLPPLLYFMAMFSWEYGIIIPLIFLFLDPVLNRKNLYASQTIIRRLVAIYIPLILTFAVYMVIRNIVNKSMPAPFPASPLERYGNIPPHALAGILSRYAYLMILPLRLSCLQALTPDFSIFISGALLIFSVALFVWLLIKKHPALPGMGIFFIGTLPPALLPIDNMLAERMTSLAIPGFCLLLGTLIGRFTESRSRFLESNKNLLVTAITLSLVIFYAVRTYTRNKEWETDVTLWNSELRVHPQSAFIYNKLALAYYKTGFTGNAEKNFRKALELEPGFSPAYQNLARLLIDAKRVEEGRKILDSGLQKGGGKDDENFANIALMYLELGLKEQAEDCFQKALQANPKNSSALMETGSILFEKGMYPESIEHFTRALESSSGRERAAILSNRSIVYNKTGELDQAAADSREALALDAQLAHPYLTLASIEAQRKFPEKSVALLEEALQKITEPPFDVYYALHQLYHSFDQPQKAFDVLHEYIRKTPQDIRGQIAVGKYCLAWYENNPEDESKLDTAITCFKNAHRLDPRNKEALILYGRTAYLSGDKESAKNIWSQVLRIYPEDQDALKLLEDLRRGRLPKPE
ncbi:tetratricopeptide repeat protein [Candidatus Sumerlaeota bacterium]|nr:tetratricopeptide repeat protein [Candidatus Sumerlaeota bacterium]